MVVFAIHSHESAMSVHVFPYPEHLSHHPPHPIPQGHPSAPALSTLSHVSNLDWKTFSLSPFNILLAVAFFFLIDVLYQVGVAPLYF